MDRRTPQNLVPQRLAELPSLASMHTVGRIRGGDDDVAAQTKRQSLPAGSSKTAEANDDKAKLVLDLTSVSTVAKEHWVKIVQWSGLVQHKLVAFLQEQTPHVTALLGELVWDAQRSSPTLASLYGLVLLGSSVGFFRFLYFISVGYATGIALPTLVSWWVHHAYTTRPTSISALLVVLWGLRAAVFYLWREFWNWPALHRKLVQVPAPHAWQQLLCWTLYSFFYLALIVPTHMVMRTERQLLFLPEATTGTAGAAAASCPTLLWPVHVFQSLNWGSVVLQILGLLLESIADFQKSAFKSRRRHAWCNVGVWAWFTHPHYLGEGLFWYATVLGNVVRLVGYWYVPSAESSISCASSLMDWRGDYQRALLLQVLPMAVAGLLLLTTVLRGAVAARHGQHTRKYGIEYEHFASQHCLLGPKWWRRREKTHSVSQGDSGMNSSSAAAAA